jgi:RHS repeat-associated protein
MVEQNRSGSYTEIVYGPTGAKLALMTGQTLQKAFVPLPGGEVAVYTSSGLAYYRHSDWLGSSRFASTPSRGMYSDGAYAPFGEPYAQSGAADVSFTGMNQDTVPNLYDFEAREYGIQGRWPSPDPAGMRAVAKLDPQTWNRYAYVRNSPLLRVDPTGMCDTETPVDAARRSRHAADCGDNGFDGAIIDPNPTPTPDPNPTPTPDPNPTPTPDPNPATNSSPTLAQEVGRGAVVGGLIGGAVGCVGGGAAGFVAGGPVGALLGCGEEGLNGIVTGAGTGALGGVVYFYFFDNFDETQ